MNAGANRRNIYILGGLVVVGGYLFYTNVLSGPSSPEPSRPSSAATRTSAAPASAPTSELQSAPRRQASSSRLSEEFRPSLKPKRPEDRVDPMSIDPTLRLDLLAKVQAVYIEGGRRNLFQVGAAPLPPEPTVTVKPGTQMAHQMGPEPAPPPPPKPTDPPPPPINLKY